MMNGISPRDLLVYVIRPTLELLQDQSGYPLATYNAEQLLLATAAQESRCGHWLHQRPSGPAMGIYQMEPPTFEWVRKALWHRAPRMWQAIDELVLANFPKNMEANLVYATAVARGRYWLVKDALPAVHDLPAMWAYYKKHWNSEKGATTEDQFAEAWMEFVDGVIRT